MQALPSIVVRLNWQLPAASSDVGGCQEPGPYADAASQAPGKIRPHLLGSISVPRVDLETPVCTLVDRCDLHPQEEVGACGVQQPLRQQPVAALDVEQPAIDGGQQGHHSCSGRTRSAPEACGGSAQLLHEKAMLGVIEAPLSALHQGLCCRGLAKLQLHANRLCEVAEGVRLHMNGVLQGYPGSSFTHTFAL